MVSGWFYRYYNAVIDMISADNGTCSVTFEGYGTTEIVKVCLLVQTANIFSLASM